MAGLVAGDFNHGGKQAMTRPWHKTPAAIARLNNPVMQAKVHAQRSAGARRGCTKRPNALPPMTPRQRRLYEKLRPRVGRDAALREVMNNG